VADCPHCGKETRVNPTQNTPQVCEHCRQEIVVG
jgi:DNA-directed RNA polymerase subunit RPC12/RpoP